jgi:hypothetical protein
VLVATDGLLAATDWSAKPQVAATSGASTVRRRADDDPDKHILRLVVTVATMAGLLGVVEVHDLGRPGKMRVAM